MMQAVRLAGVGAPTPGQIESYRRDGFLIVEQFLEPVELDRIREHFVRVFEHEWETGLAPDEVATALRLALREIGSRLKAQGSSLSQL